MKSSRIGVAAATLLLVSSGAHAQDIVWEWASSDVSKLTVKLLAGDEFIWKNPDGSEIRFKAGSGAGERTLTFDDTETKAGKFVFPLGSLVKALASVDYGMDGEPALVSTAGQITGGQGQFTLSMAGGFDLIDDFEASFNAHIVSTGNDNPLQFAIYGQGDQLRFPTPGTVSYSSKWTSSDVFPLSNGQNLAMGNFLLVTTAEPSAFHYSVMPDGMMNAVFTITDKYQFVHDLSQPATGDNLRFELPGSTVTKQVVGQVVGPALQPGDADRNLQFDFQDIVIVLGAGKYNTGEPANWSEGDWNGGPGGNPLLPPPGDGRFDFADIVAALGTGLYNKGPYGQELPTPLPAVSPGGSIGDSTISIVYDPATGEIAIDAAGLALTAFSVKSASGVFTGAAATGLGGPFDIDSDTEIAKAVFGGSFGSLSFGYVAATGLSASFLLTDLTVTGALSPSGTFGAAVDLVYVPEPASALMLLGIAAMALPGRRIRRA